jgi:hypothetical protein
LAASKRLLDDRPGFAGGELAVVGLAAGLEVGRVIELERGPVDEFVDVFALLVVAQDLVGQEALGLLPVALVERLAVCQLGGGAEARRRAEDHGEPENGEQQVRPVTHHRVPSHGTEIVET